jgi:hypothetical protein
MANDILLQENLKELFLYENGNFYWKIKPTKRYPIGMKAGTLAKRGCLHISFDGKVHKAHRLVFLYHHGYMPIEVDHIDGNPLNNKIENLREASRSENLRNTKKRIDNKSGYKGVCWDKRSKKWRTVCSVNKKQYSAGSYKDLDIAIKSVQILRQSLHLQFTRHE